jgi:hypothetical protein
VYIVDVIAPALPIPPFLGTAFGGRNRTSKYLQCNDLRKQVMRLNAFFRFSITSHNAGVRVGSSLSFKRLKMKHK